MTCRIDRGLVLLWALTAAVYAWYFGAAVMPIHDTEITFQAFHYFYSTYLYNGELAQWFPYGTYGVQAAYRQFASIAPVDYLVGLVGALAGVRDVLLLFKVSVLLQALMMVTGMYLLGKQLYRERAPAIMAPLALLIGTFWLTQILFMVRVVYAVPLVLWMLVKFVRERRGEWLWTGGIVGVVFLAGCPGYTAVYHFYTYSVFLGVLLLYNRGGWCEMFRPSWRSVTAFVVFVAVAVAFAYMLSHSLDGATITSEGRTADGAVDIESYLHLSGEGATDLTLMMASFLLGKTIYSTDAIFYFGAVSFMLFVYALLRVRREECMAAAFAAIFLIALGLCAGFSRIAYYALPGMKYVRHLGHFASMARVFMALCAGFALDHILGLIRQGAGPSAAMPFARDAWRGKASYILIAVLVLVAADGLAHDTYLRAAVKEANWYNYFRVVVNFYTVIAFETPPEMAFNAALIGLIRLGISISLVAALFAVWWFMVRSGRNALRVIAFSVVAAIAIDAFAFHYYYVRQSDHITRADLPLIEQFKAQPLAYRPVRDMSIDDANVLTDRQLALLVFPFEELSLRNTKTLYTFFQIDPCVFDLFNNVAMNYLPKGVDLLLKNRDWVLSHRSIYLASRKDDPWLNQALGCSAPKLRVVGNTVTAGSIDDAYKFVRKMPLPGAPVVLRNDGGKFPKEPPLILSVRPVVNHGEFTIEGVFPALGISGWKTDVDYPHTAGFIINANTPMTFTEYMLKAGFGGNQDFMPLAWNLYGSMNGEDWVLLDSRGPVAPWKPNEERRYEIPRPGRYLNLSLNIISGEPNKIYVNKIRLTKTVEPMVMPGENPPGTAAVTRFSPNELEADVNVEAAGGAWLYYADAYHRGWRAEVDGQAAPILEANLAFKAVRVPAGRHRVSFRFHDAVMTPLSYAVAVISIIVMVALAAGLARVIFAGGKPQGSE